MTLKQIHDTKICTMKIKSLPSLLPYLLLPKHSMVSFLGIFPETFYPYINTYMYHFYIEMAA